MQKATQMTDLMKSYDKLMTAARRWFKDVTDEEIHVILLGAVTKAINDVQGK